MKKNIQTSISLILFLCAQTSQLFSAAAAEATAVSRETDSIDFLEATAHDDMPKIIFLLDKDIDIEIKKTGNQSNALMNAAHSGNTQLIDILCSRKVNINTQDKFKNTPLMYAAYSDERLALQSLLMRGANYSLKNSDGYDLGTLLNEEYQSGPCLSALASIKAFYEHKQSLACLVGAYKKIDTKPLKRLKLVFPPKEYPGTVEEQLACHQLDIVPIKKILYAVKLVPIFNEINIAPIITDYLTPFIEE